MGLGGTAARGYLLVQRHEQRCQRSRVRGELAIDVHAQANARCSAPAPGLIPAGPFAIKCHAHLVTVIAQIIHRKCAHLMLINQRRHHERCVRLPSQPEQSAEDVVDKRAVNKTCVVLSFPISVPSLSWKKAISLTFKKEKQEPVFLPVHVVNRSFPIRRRGRRFVPPLGRVLIALPTPEHLLACNPVAFVRVDVLSNVWWRAPTRHAPLRHALGVGGE